MMIFRISPFTIFSIIVLMLRSTEKNVGKRVIKDIPHL